MVITQSYDGAGITLKDLREFVNKCDYEGLSDNTPIVVCQHESLNPTPVRDMVATEDNVKLLGFF